MRSLLPFAPAAIACVATAMCATAQLGAPRPNFALPGGTHRIDVQSALFNATYQQWDAFLGVARDAVGNYWVTARRTPRLPLTNPHMLFEFDAFGNYVAGYTQPAAAQSSNWGIRDLAFDGSRYLFGGFEGDRVLAFDTVSRTWAPAFDWTVPSGLTFSTIRALAYDPTGDNGSGSLWTANFSSEHVEFSRTGNVLSRVANIQPGTYGAAYDPVRETIWWFGQSGSARAATHVVATEMDAATGQPTQHKTLGDLGIAGIEAGGFAGGAEFYTDTSGAPVLLLCAQADSDTIYELFGRFDYGASSGGVASFRGGAAFAGNTAFEVTLEGSNAQTAAVLIGTGETNLPLPIVPLFAPNTNWLIDTSLFNFFGPSTTVVSASASQPLPLSTDPVLIGLRLYFQWAELAFSGPTLLPIELSTGGKIYIHG